MRDVNTYRSNRRNAWRELTRGLSWTGWSAYKQPRYTDEKGYGSVVHGLMTAHVARSKYTPHIGKKQREKGAQA